MSNKSIDDELSEIDSKISSVLSSASEQMPQEWWNASSSIFISLSILAFASLVLITSAYLIKQGINSESILRVFGLILIIVFSTFLIVVGYSDQQIAPVIGLLGTIAGYLLGNTK